MEDTVRERSHSERSGEGIERNDGWSSIRPNRFDICGMLKREGVIGDLIICSKIIGKQQSQYIRKNKMPWHWGTTAVTLFEHEIK